MDSIALPPVCALCDRLGTDRCRRCQRPVCDRHGPADEAGEGMGGCAGCLGDARRRGGLSARVAVVGAAAVGGMAVGAAATMLLGSLLGLGPELLILLMLVVELAAGGLSAWVADRRLDRWLEDRARAALESHMPVARLLHGGK